MDFKNEEERFIIFYELWKNANPDALVKTLEDYKQTNTIAYNINQTEVMECVNLILPSIELFLSGSEKFIDAIMNVSKYYIANNDYSDDKYKKLLQGYSTLFRIMQIYAKSIDPTIYDIKLLLKKADALDEKEMNKIKSRIGSIQDNKYVLMSKMFGKKSDEPSTNEEMKKFVLGLLGLYIDVLVIPFGRAILMEQLDDASLLLLLKESNIGRKICERVLYLLRENPKFPNENNMLHRNFNLWYEEWESIKSGALNETNNMQAEYKGSERVQDDPENKFKKAASDETKIEDDEKAIYKHLGVSCIVNSILNCNGYSKESKLKVEEVFIKRLSTAEFDIGLTEFIDDVRYLHNTIGNTGYRDKVEYFDEFSVLFNRFTKIIFGGINGSLITMVKYNSDETNPIVDYVFYERILPEVIEVHHRLKRMDADVCTMMDIVYVAAKLRKIGPCLKYITDGCYDSKEERNKGLEVELSEIDDEVNNWISEYVSSYKAKNIDAKLTKIILRISFNTEKQEKLMEMIFEMMTFLYGTNLYKVKLCICINMLMEKLSKETGEGMEQVLERLITKYKVSRVYISNTINNMIPECLNRMEEEVAKEMADKPLMFILGITLEPQEVKEIIEYINTRIMCHIYEWLKLYLPDDVIYKASKNNELSVGLMVYGKFWFVNNILMIISEKSTYESTFKHIRSRLDEKKKVYDNEVKLLIRMEASVIMHLIKMDGYKIQRLSTEYFIIAMRVYRERNVTVTGLSEFFIECDKKMIELTPNGESVEKYVKEKAFEDLFKRIDARKRIEEANKKSKDTDEEAAKNTGLYDTIRAFAKAKKEGQENASYALQPQKDKCSIMIMSNAELNREMNYSISQARANGNMDISKDWKAKMQAMTEEFEKLKNKCIELAKMKYETEKMVQEQYNQIKNMINGSKDSKMSAKEHVKNYLIDDIKKCNFDELLGIKPSKGNKSKKTNNKSKNTAAGKKSEELAAGKNGELPGVITTISTIDMKINTRDEMKRIIDEMDKFKKIEKNNELEKLKEMENKLNVIESMIDKVKKDIGSYVLDEMKKNELYRIIYNMKNYICIEKEEVMMLEYKIVIDKIEPYVNAEMNNIHKNSDKNIKVGHELARKIVLGVCRQMLYNKASTDNDWNNMINKDSRVVNDWIKVIDNCLNIDLELPMTNEDRKGVKVRSDELKTRIEAESAYNDPKFWKTLAIFLAMLVISYSHKSTIETNKSEDSKAVAQVAEV